MDGGLIIRGENHFKARSQSVIAGLGHVGTKNEKLPQNTIKRLRNEFQ